MQKVSSFFDVRRTSGIVVASFVSILMVALLTYGATTISTNISTGGTLDVTGATTLTGALTANGAVTLGDAIGDNITITGNATSSNAFNVAGNLFVNGNATTSGATGNFATQGTLTVGNSGSAIASMVFGTCNLTSATLAASTTANFACTSATGVQSGDKVFVAATSSLSVANPYNNDIVIRSASSSVSGQINVDIVNTDDNSATETVAGTLNFWAFRSP